MYLHSDVFVDARREWESAAFPLASLCLQVFTARLLSLRKFVLVNCAPLFGGDSICLLTSDSEGTVGGWSFGEEPFFILLSRLGSEGVTSKEGLESPAVAIGVFVCTRTHDFIFLLYGHNVEHTMDQVVSSKCAILRYDIHTLLQTSSPHASRNMIPTKCYSSAFTLPSAWWPDYSPPCI